jgi:hypothetical protein
MNGQWVGFAAVICMFGGPFIVGGIWMILRAWERVTIQAQEIELKHRLLDAGMTPDEIERVLNAGSAAADRHADAAEAPRDAQSVA